MTSAQLFLHDVLPEASASCNLVGFTRLKTIGTFVNRNLP